MQLSNWYKKLDLYIHLSEGETSSTSILQALSFGLPVIASKIEGNLNLLRFNKKIPNMVLVTNKKEEIFRKIKILHENEKIRNQLKHSSQLSIEKFFSSEVMFKKYKKLF